MEDATNLWKEGAMDLEAYTLIDPNEIRVSITDPAPIVILFGPSGCGKTMTLVRLTRWLQENGYYVKPDRPANEKKQKRISGTLQLL